MRINMRINMRITPCPEVFKVYNLVVFPPSSLLLQHRNARETIKNKRRGKSQSYLFALTDYHV
jgi:hypothetical protein